MKFSLTKTFQSIAGVHLLFGPEDTDFASRDSFKAALVIALESNAQRDGQPVQMTPAEGMRRNAIQAKMLAPNEDGEIEIDAGQVALLKDLFCAALPPIAAMPILEYLESGKAS